MARYVQIGLGAALAVIVSMAGAAAENAPVGIAIVQAPEQPIAISIGRNMRQAFEEATAQCVGQGGLAEECVRTSWCAPAGWTVDVFVQHREGPHWHEVVCGLPSETAARGTALHMCDRTERDYLIECLPVQIYDPSGAPIMKEAQD